MNETPLPWSPESFERRYRTCEDPWRFATCPRERSRFDTLIKSLGHRRYEHALEVGCAEGVLTARLAGRCNRLDAIDVAPTALRRARVRCAHLENIRFYHRSVEELPAAAAYDLIVMSEVGYYFDVPALGAVVMRLFAALTSGGEFVLSHWTGSSDDHQLHADDVHSVAAGHAMDSPSLSLRADSFRLDRWTKRLPEDTP